MNGLSLPQPAIADDYAMQRHALEPWLSEKFDAVLSRHLDQLIVCEEFFRCEEGRP
jgi:hypothetical protein